jgi:hypothetical protein
VSRVRARGSHSSPVVYRANVAHSAHEIVTLVEQLNPRLVIVGDLYAFRELARQILPDITWWRGDVVRTRNPSVQSHRGSVLQWQMSYRSFRSDLMLQPRPSTVRKWHYTRQTLRDRSRRSALLVEVATTSVRAGSFRTEPPTDVVTRARCGPR